MVNIRVSYCQEIGLDPSYRRSCSPRGIPLLAATLPSKVLYVKASLLKKVKYEIYWMLLQQKISLTYKVSLYLLIFKRPCHLPMSKQTKDWGQFMLVFDESLLRFWRNHANSCTTVLFLQYKLISQINLRSCWATFVCVIHGRCLLTFLDRLSF